MKKIYSKKMLLIDLFVFLFVGILYLLLQNIFAVIGLTEIYNKDYITRTPNEGITESLSRLCCIILLTTYLIIRKRKLSFNLKDFLLGMLLGISTFAIGGLLVYKSLQWLNTFGFLYDYEGFTDAIVLNIVLMAVYNLLIGTFEELHFRALLLGGFKEFFHNKKYGFLLSVFLSSTLFSLVHLFNLRYQSIDTTVEQMLLVFVFGWLSGVIYYKTQNIICLVLIHGFHDFSNKLYYYCKYMSNNTAFSKSYDNLIEYCLETFGSLIIIVIFVIIIQKQENKRLKIMECENKSLTSH